MTRQEIIETVTQDAVNSYEFSCSWKSVPAIIVDELKFHGIQPTKPLVFHIVNLAKLAWAGQVQRVKNIIREAAELGSYN
jgi:hypothetical protein